MRLRSLVRKEFLQVLRDPSSIAIAFLMPVILLLLFGYGVSLDAEDVPVALVVERPGGEASAFCSGFRASRYFDPSTFLHMRGAVEALKYRRADAIVHLRSDFARGGRGAETGPVQVVVNGVDANRARMVAGYVQGVWMKWLEQEAVSQGRALSLPVDVRQRVWFNGELRSRNFLAPGLVAVIMTLIGALLTALVMAREWERGTMESLMVTPATMLEILLGKLLPYFLLGMGGMVLSTVMTLELFEVPLRGSPWVLFSGAALFLLAALGMGLLISTVARSQFVAAQTAIIVTFLPAFILSGFIFDINSMPRVVQAITHLIAARYFVAILQTVFLAGDVWPVLVPNGLALLAMAGVFLGLTALKSRKRLS